MSGISPEYFVNTLKKLNIDFFCGVPDSLLSGLSGYLLENESNDQHVITANEGNAVGLAIGHYLATGKKAMVYLQNSGLGNAVNPLASLADKDVYAIPLLLVVGWRGEPGFKDEPQHYKQGNITIDQLKLLGIPFFVIDKETTDEEFNKKIKFLLKNSTNTIAIVIKKGGIQKYKKQSFHNANIGIFREDALKCLLDISREELFISTTGKTSREIFELRELNGNNSKDFLVIGGMGHASSIAQGIAMSDIKRPIVCLDGDGSLIMHMGAMSTIGKYLKKGFQHIVFNNKSHESVGGQPTAANIIDFEKIAYGCNYKWYAKVDTLHELKKKWIEMKTINGPSMLEIICRVGSRDDLGRPNITPQKSKEFFMDSIKNS